MDLTVIDNSLSLARQFYFIQARCRHADKCHSWKDADEYRVPAPIAELLQDAIAVTVENLESQPPAVVERHWRCHPCAFHRSDRASQMLRSLLPFVWDRRHVTTS